MAAQKVSKLINLLPQEEFVNSTFGRVFTWAMSSFRIIVIAIEMVVMVAFLSRFWLDARNVDLNDLIKQKSAVIASQSEFEQEFRDLQKRIKVFSGITGIEKLPSQYLNTLVSYMPNDIRLDSISQSGDTFQIKGNSFNEVSISQFLVNLDKSGQYDKVQVSNLDSDQEEGGLLTFVLKLTPKKGGSSGTTN
jgi:Tfp pilus assembly protein PilN